MYVRERQCILAVESPQHTVARGTVGQTTERHRPGEREREREEERVREREERRAGERERGMYVCGI